VEERQDEEDAAGVADLRAGLLAREFASVASISDLVGVVVAVVVAAEVGEGGVCWEKECARAE